MPSYQRIDNMYSRREALGFTEKVIWQRRCGVGADGDGDGCGGGSGNSDNTASDTSIGGNSGSFPRTEETRSGRKLQDWLGKVFFPWW